MSALADALTALKNVVLLQERLGAMRQDFDSLSSDVRGLKDYIVAVDKRLVRIEALAEVAKSRGGPPRIEG